MINERIVLDYYLEQMREDNILFLKGKDEYKSEIEECIIKLRDEVNMHNRIQTAKKLWKLLFETSMSFIDPDKRGYDELFKYFDRYVDFEELIFASDSFYRDHTLHCLWVYFLGEYIMKHNEFSIFVDRMNDQERILQGAVNSIKNMGVENIFKDLLDTFESVAGARKNQESVRCISALTHDLGYPLKKIGKINKCIKDVLPYFGVESYDEFNFSYDNIQQNFIGGFIDMMSTELTWASRDDNEENDELVLRCLEIDEKNTLFIGFREEEVKKLKREELIRLRRAFTLKPERRKKLDNHYRYSNDFEQYQHGIMSAYLLMKTVKSFRNMKYSYIDNLNIHQSYIDFPDILAKTTILRSIADHTSSGYQIYSIRDSSDFLAFIDELEEFSRMSRANQNRQYVNEFCKTNIYAEEGWLNIDFIFDNTKIENLDPERAFKGRCEKFLTLFNVPKLDDNLKIRLSCIGKLPYDDNVYTLEIGRKHARISINDEEQNIPKYLKSRQFYTREEYMKM